MKFWMIELQRDIGNRDFQKSKNLCQLMNRVLSWVDLTDSNVISVPLSVRRPEITQALGRCVTHL